MNIFGLTILLCAIRRLGRTRFPPEQVVMRRNDIEDDVILALILVPEHFETTRSVHLQNTTEINQVAR